MLCKAYSRQKALAGRIRDKFGTCTRSRSDRNAGAGAERRAGAAAPGRTARRHSGDLLDLLLAKAKVDGRAIKGYDNVEFTHAAVAAYVASDMADAGFGLETPAQRFGLDYIPIVRERYFFLCPRAVYETQVFDRVLAILRSNEFRKIANALPGYDAKHCGRVLDVFDAFTAPRTSSSPRIDAQALPRE